jgi:hypothetical protein
VVPRRRDSILALRLYGRDELITEQVDTPAEREELKAELEECKRSSTDIPECRKAEHVARLIKRANSGNALEGHDSSQLARSVSNLAHRVPDVARAQELFNTLAIFRWAKQAGAQLQGKAIPLAKKRPQTPDVVIVGILENFIAGAPDPGDWADECAKMVRRLIDIGNHPIPQITANKNRYRYVLALTRKRLDDANLISQTSEGITVHCDRP